MLLDYNDDGKQLDSDERILEGTQNRQSSNNNDLNLLVEYRVDEKMLENDQDSSPTQV